MDSAFVERVRYNRGEYLFHGGASIGDSEELFYI